MIVYKHVVCDELFVVKENCREELLRAAREKEQQASLAVEEAELQKSAVQAEGEAKARELQLELESMRTVSLPNHLPANFI